jgi:hypothetical protein
LGVGRAHVGRPHPLRLKKTMVCQLLRAREISVHLLRHNSPMLPQLLPHNSPMMPQLLRHDPPMFAQLVNNKGNYFFNAL